MKIIDISMELSSAMITYEGDPRVKMDVIKSFSKNGVLLSKISMGLHSGTHVDSGLHYLRNGESIDKIDLKSLVGKARVCDLISAKSSITVSDLKTCGMKKDEIILLKTRNSKLLGKKLFSRGFVHLSENAADYLVGKRIKAVGIDYLSVEKFRSRENYVHKKLLSCKIPIIEGLDLRKVEPGEYVFYCLPLKIKGGEASPARCILIR